MNEKRDLFMGSIDSDEEIMLFGEGVGERIAGYPRMAVFDQANRSGVNFHPGYEIWA
jgi:hypothetical protein